MGKKRTLFSFRQSDRNGPTDVKWKQNNSPSAATTQKKLKKEQKCAKVVVFSMGKTTKLSRHVAAIAAEFDTLKKKN